MARLQKKSVTLSGHDTSVALEGAFWTVLQQMAAAQGIGLPQLMRQLDETRERRPLASACRVAALEWALRTGAEP